jgi:hypothetical protein
METGVTVHHTAFIFHQHTEYCVQGQLIQPGYLTYSWSDNIDELWQCQSEQENFNIITMPTPNAVLAHSSGRCWWYADAGPAGTIETGRYAPTIHDMYGNNGERWLRSGSSH